MWYHPGCFYAVTYRNRNIHACNNSPRNAYSAYSISELDKRRITMMLLTMRNYPGSLEDPTSSPSRTSNSPDQHQHQQLNCETPLASYHCHSLGHAPPNPFVSALLTQPQRSWRPLMRTGRAGRPLSAVREAVGSRAGGGETQSLWWLDISLCQVSQTSASQLEFLIGRHREVILRTGQWAQMANWVQLHLVLMKK